MGCPQRPGRPWHRRQSRFSGRACCPSRRRPLHAEPGYCAPSLATPLPGAGEPGCRSCTPRSLAWCPLRGARLLVLTKGGMAPEPVQGYCPQSPWPACPRGCAQAPACAAPAALSRQRVRQGVTASPQPAGRESPRRHPPPRSRPQGHPQTLEREHPHAAGYLPPGAFRLVPFRGCRVSLAGP